MMRREAKAIEDKRHRSRQPLLFALRGKAGRSAAACAAVVLIAAGSALPVSADPALREALPSSEAIGWLLETEATGSAAPWINSRSGYSGTVTVTEAWDQADGAPCRTYTIAAVAGGSPTILKGMGCRVGPGEWNLKEGAPAVMAATRPPPPARKPAATAAMTPADPATAAAPPALTPAVVPSAPLAPVDDGAVVAVDPTPARLPADAAEHKPGAIAARLPSRSDE